MLLMLLCHYCTGIVLLLYYFTKTDTWSIEAGQVEGTSLQNGVIEVWFRAFELGTLKPLNPPVRMHNYCTATKYCIATELLYFCSTPF